MGVICLRGIGGSGKTYAMLRIIERLRPAKVRDFFDASATAGYRAGGVYIVGDYSKGEASAGGRLWPGLCWRYTMDDVAFQAKENRSVLYERSGVDHTADEVFYAVQIGIRFGFLDTPKEICERRMAAEGRRGRYTLAEEYALLMESRTFLQRSGVECFDVPHAAAVDFLMGAI